LRDVWLEHLSPTLNDFRPDLILVSAGFDAHRLDPLAGLDFVEQDYYWITRQILAVAKTHCRGRLVSTLEGGYHLPALAASAAAHCQALLEG
jgi:acetoin utilization deacetylase AcuC-like enzyme